MEQASNNLRLFPPKHARRRRLWMALALFFIIAICIIRSAVVDWNDVLSSSMEPSIIPGDRLLVNKVAYNVRIPFTNRILLEWTDPERGDVVVFDRDDGPGMIKRVIGIPGDVVSLRRNHLTINGHNAWYEPFENEFYRKLTHGGFRQYQAVETMPGARHPILLTPENPGPSFYPTRIPEGHVLVLGDNRDNSEDSRFFGPVPINRIVGRVSRIVLSIDYEDGFDFRSERFWTPLP